MSFLHPEFIYMMLPVLVALFAMLTTQADLKAQIFSAEVLEKLRVESDQLSTRTRNIFFLLMFVFIILALAEPVVKEGDVWLEEEDLSYYLLVDIDIIYPEKVQKSLQGVIKRYELPLGLIVLDAQEYLLCSATKDKHYLLERVDLLNSFYQNRQRQSLHSSTTLQSFLEQKGRKAILISDSVLSNTFKKLIERYDIEVIGSDKSERLYAYLDKNVDANKPKPLYSHLFIIPIALAMLMFIIATSSFYRGEKHFVPLLLFCILSFSPRAEATLFSFEALQEAKKQYEKGEYEACAKAYYHYALAHESREATYNAANCYFYTGQYEHAAALYRSIAFVEREKEYSRYFNLGGALVKQGGMKALLEARAVYLKARDIHTTEVLEEKLDTVDLQLSQRRHFQRSRDSVVKREDRFKKAASSEDPDLNDEVVLERRLREANDKHIYLLRD